MKKKYIEAHMKAAYVYAQLSSCQRRKVGCVIVKHNSIIAIGYNGTPSGEDNCCEDTTTGLTKPQVIHAEDNALRKLTNSSESGAGAVMFVTTAPCVFCASRIVDAGIKHVFYDDLYRSADGVAYLQDRGITVDQISI